MSELVTNRDAERAESRARSAAELVLGTELLPGPVPLPDFVSLMRGRARWRRRTLMLGGAASVAAVALAVVTTLRESAPISYVVDGTVAIADGVIDAAGGPGEASESEPASAFEDFSASVRFSEGTEVGLARGARLRVVGRNAHGAALALDRGRARFAVTHRAGARWSVATGPFTVDVIGTRFTLDWSPRDERLVVDLIAGSVHVHGASVGGPVAMHPGERLIATAGDRRVTLSPLAHGESAPEVEALVEGKADANFEAQPLPEAAAEASAVTSAEERAFVPVRAATRAGSHRSSSSRRMDLALASPSRVAPARAGSSSPVAVAAPLPGPSAAAKPAAPAPTSEPPAVMPPGEAMPPAFAPQPLAHTLRIGGGGAACARESAQYRFERLESGISLPDYYTLAFSSPRPDRSHSWCGQSSLRVDANFNDAGRRNFFGRFAKETGQVVIKLHRATDFTGRTVSVHFFVDGPPDARFTAELVVVNRGRWVSGPPSGQLVAGRWWTISHKFEAENESGVPGSSNPGPFPVGGTSPVTSCDRLGLAIHSTGGRRVWNGAVYIDDVGWR